MSMTFVQWCNYLLEQIGIIYIADEDYNPIEFTFFASQIFPVIEAGSSRKRYDYRKDGNRKLALVSGVSELVSLGFLGSLTQTTIDDRAEIWLTPAGKTFLENWTDYREEYGARLGAVHLSAEQKRLLLEINQRNSFSTDNYAYIRSGVLYPYDENDTDGSLVWVNNTETLFTLATELAGKKLVGDISKILGGVVVTPTYLGLVWQELYGAE